MDFFCFVLLFDLKQFFPKVQNNGWLGLYISTSGGGTTSQLFIWIRCSFFFLEASKETNNVEESVKDSLIKALWWAPVFVEKTFF